MRLAIGKDLVKRALSAHASIGLIAAALLYIICLSGTVVVLYEELQRIEQPRVPEMAGLAPGAVQAAVAAVAAREAGRPRTTHLFVHFPTPGLPRATLTTDTQAFHVDAAGRIVAAEENNWSEFLLDLHYRLHLPATFGMIVVGIFGVAMLALAITGILAHPRIFRDAFRLRARGGGEVGLTDWHNRLGVWTLPFALALALTGAVIGLALPAAYGVAARFYGGDVEATYATIFGAEAKPDPRPAPLPDVAGPLRWMAAHVADARVTFLTIHDPMTMGQHVQIFAAPPRRLVYGEAYGFDGGGGPPHVAGLAGGHIGQQASASVYNLHFGNYGGLPVKLAYVLIGLALCIVTGSGTTIWLDKRRRRGIHEPRLRGGWAVIVWGTPALLAVTFAARMLIGDAAPFAAIFWIGTALLLLLAFVLPQADAIRARCRIALAGISALALILALTA